MSFEAAERLARALAFEGYVLYPYRASSLKNQRRWAFGTLYPETFCESAAAGDASRMVTECVVTGTIPRVRVVVKFLQLVARTGVAEPWNEALERSIDTDGLALSSLATAAHRFETTFSAPRSVEDGVERVGETLSAVVTVSAAALSPAVWRLSVVIDNATLAPAGTTRAAAELRALASVHTLLECRDGRFTSQTEPPAHLESYTRSCKNVGAWPVLVGDPARADVLLASPIILPDYPSVAAASPGDLFDATEIDEILSLRIRTLTHAERREVVRTDPRARALLERTEALGEGELLALHGVGSLFERRPRSHPFAPGDRVVLRPVRGGDVFDLALSGEVATVLGVEEDVDGHVLFTVTVDADPGRDLGELGLPGHRFFFTAEELERAP